MHICVYTFTCVCIYIYIHIIHMYYNITLYYSIALHIMKRSSNFVFIILHKQYIN